MLAMHLYSSLLGSHSNDLLSGTFNVDGRLEIMHEDHPHRYYLTALLAFSAWRIVQSEERIHMFAVACGLGHITAITRKRRNAAFWRWNQLKALHECDHRNGSKKKRCLSMMLCWSRCIASGLTMHVAHMRSPCGIAHLLSSYAISVLGPISSIRTPLHSSAAVPHLRCHSAKLVLPQSGMCAPIRQRPSMHSPDI